jgi:hypothetical protein
LPRLAKTKVAKFIHLGSRAQGPYCYPKIVVFEPGREILRICGATSCYQISCDVAMISHFLLLALTKRVAASATLTAVAEHQICLSAANGVRTITCGMYIVWHTACFDTPTTHKGDTLAIAAKKTATAPTPSRKEFMNGSETTQLQ